MSAETGLHLCDGIGLWFERRTDRHYANKAALFLDRDGVIVEETKYLGRVSDVVAIADVAPAIASANAAGVAVVLVTNQAGIARRYFDWHDFHSVQAEIMRGLAQEGAHLDLILACAYHADGDEPYRIQDHDWRKPAPGMFAEAIATLGVDPRRSIIVGDKLSDLQAGQSAGLRHGTLTLTGHGRDEVDQVRSWAEGLTQKDLFEMSIMPSAGPAIIRWLDWLAAELSAP